MRCAFEFCFCCALPDCAFSRLVPPTKVSSGAQSVKKRNRNRGNTEVVQLERLEAAMLVLSF